jgi:hypothetical protein
MLVSVTVLWLLTRFEADLAGRLIDWARSQCTVYSHQVGDQFAKTTIPLGFRRTVARTSRVLGPTQSARSLLVNLSETNGVAH